MTLAESGGGVISTLTSEVRGVTAAAEETPSNDHKMAATIAVIANMQSKVNS